MANQPGLPGYPPAPDIGLSKTPPPPLNTPTRDPLPARGGAVAGPPNMNFKAIRAFLIRKGYQGIPAMSSPKFHSIFKSALADFLDKSHTGHAIQGYLGDTKITGKRDPLAWRKRVFGNYETQISKNQVAGPPITEKGSNPAPKSPKSNDPPIDLSSLATIASGVGVPIPTSMANKLAGLEYDAGIRDLGVAQQRQPVQAAQNLHDIKNWYDQVLGSQATASQRDREINQAGVGSVKNAVQAIIGSLGGKANQGSPMVGAAGANDVGTLAALGSAQDQYNQDIRPILHAEAAGATSRQIARNNQDAQDIQNQIVDLQGKRGQARAEQLMKIMGYNNDLSQQEFTNRLQLEQMREAAALTGAKIVGLGAAKQPKRISPNVLIGAANAAVDQFDDGNGGYSTKGLGVQGVVRLVNNIYLGAGLDLHDSQVAQSAMAALSRLGVNPDPRWYKQARPQARQAAAG